MGQSSKINPAKLHALTNRPGALHRISQKKPGGSLMQGDFLLTQQVSGIWVHASRVEELQDAVSTFELPPGLSFTFMFKGEATFSIGGGEEHCYKVSPQANVIECSALCLSQNEIMSRRMKKGQKVYKLNISIDKTNLESRCLLANDNMDIDKLFQNHGAIHRWQISSELKTLVLKLMAIVNKESLLQRLHIESYASEILFHVLSRLKTECAKTQPINHVENIQKNFKSNTKRLLAADALREKVDLLLDQSFELEDIAKQFNMSISTLQRKFKMACNYTVIEYIRRKRLENARNKMISDGINLTQAASIAGYKHPANFITAFKKTFGRTPHAYCKGLN